MADDDSSGVQGGGGSRRGSDSETTFGGGGSSTDAGSGVTGGGGSDTTFGGGGSGGTDAPTGSTGADDPSGDDDSGVVGGGGDRRGSDSGSGVRDGGNTDTDAGSGLTGGDRDTTFEGGGRQSSTQAPEGSTGADDPTQADEPTAQERADEALDGDADRGVSFTRPGDLAAQEQPAQAPDRELNDGLEEEVGALSGEEGPLADQVQQLQGRISRETDISGVLDTDEFDIVREGDQLRAEFASQQQQRRRQRAQDVAIRDAVITGGPEAGSELVTPRVQAGESGDRGVGITRGPEGIEVTRPRQTAADVTQFGQQQLDAQQAPSAGEVRADVSQFGQAQLDQVSLADSRRELIEPPEATATELITGQAGGPRLQRGLINEGLEAAGLEEELGFRERTREQTQLDAGDEPALAFARGAGRRREETILEPAAAPAREQLAATARTAQENPLQALAAGAPVALAEPTPVGEAGLLAGAIGGAVGIDVASRIEDDNLDARTRAFGGEELAVPEEPQQSELDAEDAERPPELGVPDDPGSGEVAVPSDTTAFPSELEAGERQRPAELSVPAGSDETPAQSSEDDTVVPGDFPLAGRDLPADPGQEFVSGERPDTPTADASPVGITEPEEPEVEEQEDDLGVPEDDPFRVSDRRLFDPQRDFGEREDVASVPDETTPESIDDVGSGIAGTGEALEPARGETVAENFEQFLDEREAERRRELARQREALREDDAEFQRELPGELPADEPGARARTAVAAEPLLGSGFDAISAFGREETGITPRDSQAPDVDTPTDARARLGTSPDTDVGVRTDSALDTAPNTSQQPAPLQTTAVVEPIVNVTTASPLATPAIPEVVLERPERVTTAPPSTSPPFSGRVPRRGDRDVDEDDDPLLEGFGTRAEPFTNPVATAEEFLGGGDV